VIVKQENGGFSRLANHFPTELLPSTHSTYLAIFWFEVREDSGEATKLVTSHPIFRRGASL